MSGLKSMEDQYEHIQTGSVNSLSGNMEHTYDKLNALVQQAEKRQTKPPTSTTVKVILGLLGAVTLIALVVAVMAVIVNQQQSFEISELKKIYSSGQTPTPHPTGGSPVTTSTFFSDTSNISCEAILKSFPSAPSGVYGIYIGGRGPEKKVWCDMVTYGGGWTRFQRRQDGTVNFNRTWNEYRTGFGGANAEFWIGNNNLHRLTAAQPTELRVDIWDFVGGHRFAKYFNFSVSDEASDYVLKVGGYSGDAGDSLSYHNYLRFTTTDRDHDGWTTGNCATKGGGGGWWYVNCEHANVNGRYLPGGVRDHEGVNWFTWRKDYYSYKAVSMMAKSTS